MPAPTNKYGKGTRKVKNSRENVTKNQVALFVKDNHWVIILATWGNSLGT